MAAQGGCPRLGKFVGPYPGGLLGHVSLRLPFFAQALCSLAAVAPVVLQSRRAALLKISDGGQDAPPSKGESPRKEAGADTSVLPAHNGFDVRTVVAALVFAFCLQLLRFAIPVIVPLIGLENGMHVSGIGLSMTIAGALEFVCFPIAGPSTSHRGGLATLDRCTTH